jgi:succinate dehydrogenase / fumarate reductase iron-sulfur subunit
MKNAVFKIHRFDPQTGKPPWVQTYEFPMSAMANGTVLEGLFHIQRFMDGSLAFRSSCREGVCGSCAAHINGKYRLACETRVESLGTNVVTIRPLAHLPVLRDLVVDMDDFWAKYKSIKPYLMPGASEPERERAQTVDERADLDLLVDCIMCASCYASCSVTATDPDYLGPAALLQANRFLQDSRDTAVEERLKLAGGEHGAFRCHTIFSCQEVCPKDLDPTGSIAAIKRRAIARRFGFR